MKPQAAVLTGDLIGSTSAPPEAVEAAMNRIALIAEKLGPEARFTRYRGDGWQMFIENPGRGLSIMLQIIADLRAARGLESRLALGLGAADMLTVSNILAIKDLLTVNGEAFVASGRALDKMQSGQRLAIAGEGVDRLHSRLISMIDERCSGWSHEQAEAMALALNPWTRPTQAEAAKQLKISRQAVAARLQSAGFAQLYGAIKDFRICFGPEFYHD